MLRQIINFARGIKDYSERNGIYIYIYILDVSLYIYIYIYIYIY